jgi:hypothetical protein
LFADEKVLSADDRFEPEREWALRSLALKSQPRHAADAGNIVNADQRPRIACHVDIPDDNVTNIRQIYSTMGASAPWPPGPVVTSNRHFQ